MHFLNVYHCIESTGRLVRVLTDEVPKPENLDSSYRSAISAIRPVAPPKSGISISFEDGLLGGYLLEKKIFQDIFVGVRSTSESTRVAWSSMVQDALRYVRELRPELGRIVELLVTDIVLLSSERTGGGSASRLPGLVCMSPGPTWSMHDFAESIMHEATHLNLFVADMVYGMCTLPTQLLAAPGYRVLSAVKVGEARPLDKAFHSAVVAVPLMYMQHLRGESALVDSFAGSLRDCVKGLQAKRVYFTSYGQMLVDELDRFA